ncbi:MAG TPA: SDR family oxidoreductase [Anaerolineaceae bacterium]
MKRLLVTGASGLLGFSLAYQVRDQFMVTGVANRHDLRSAPFTLLVNDLTAPGSLEALYFAAKPEIIVHCAAIANLEQAEANPTLAQRLNAEVPGEMASLARQKGVQFLHISTDAVFDGTRGNYREEDTPNPLSVYARTKLAGEQAVTQANPDALIARVNFYGWSLTGQRSLAEWFINNLKAGRRVTGFTDVFFGPLQVNLLVEILLKMLARGLSGIYHVVSSETLSKYDFGVRLAERFGLNPELITPGVLASSGLVARRSPRLTLDPAKLSLALGEPLPGQAAGIERLHQQYLDGYPARIQALLT